MQLKKEIAYPLSGILSVIIGILIISSGLNIHSEEVFIFLIAIFGFILLFPLIFLIKSIQLLTIKKDEESRTKIYATTLTIVLGLSWLTLVVIGIWNLRI